MIYPQNFEQKIGFDQIRRLLKEKCLSTLGEERVMDMAFSDHFGEVEERLDQVTEFVRILQEEDNFPAQYFFDVRPSLKRIRVEGMYVCPTASAVLPWNHIASRIQDQTCGQMPEPSFVPYSDSPMQMLSSSHNIFVHLSLIKLSYFSPSLRLFHAAQIVKICNKCCQHRDCHYRHFQYCHHNEPNKNIQ